MSSKWFFFSGRPNKTPHAFPFSLIHASCPAHHPPLFDRPNNRNTIETKLSQSADLLSAEDRPQTKMKSGQVAG
jgi:hypothetical protein